MNYEEKFEVFLDLAKKLNKKFSVIPLLQGSLGLKMLVNDDLNPSDIDIAVFVDDSAKETMHDIFRKAQRCTVHYVLDIQILIFSKSMLAEPAGIVEEIVLYGKDITFL